MLPRPVLIRITLLDVPGQQTSLSMWLNPPGSAGTTSTQPNCFADLVQEMKHQDFLQSLTWLCPQHPPIAQTEVQMGKGSFSLPNVLSFFLPTNSPAHHLLCDLTHVRTHPWEQGISCNGCHLLAGTCLCWMLSRPCSAPSSP